MNNSEKHDTILSVKIQPQYHSLLQNKGMLVLGNRKFVAQILAYEYYMPSLTIMNKFFLPLPVSTGKEYICGITLAEHFVYS